MMNALARHLSRCFLSGIVALLPIGGLVLSVAYMESAVAKSWLARQPFYFPGLGLLATAAIIYGIGLTVSTFVGRWLWARMDTMFNHLPFLGRLYLTFKQILGYGEGKEGMFHEVVLVPNGETASEELGLVTNRIDGENGTQTLIVFVPGAPNPTTGRLLLIDATLVRRLDIPVSEALKALVSVGKTSLEIRNPTEQQGTSAFPG